MKECFIVLLPHLYPCILWAFPQYWILTTAIFIGTLTYCIQNNSKDDRSLV